MKKCWKIDEGLLTDELSLAALIAAADREEHQFVAYSSSLVESLPVLPPKRFRAKDFPFKAEGKVIRELETRGARMWLLRVKEDASTDITLRSIAEFVAYCKSKVKDYCGLVLRH